ncbi:MAG: hypothetical protein WBO10_15270 [Pyrinomonadaceae bacterium]
MKNTLALSVFVLIASVSSIFSQSNSEEPVPSRPIVVVTNSVPPAQTVKQPATPLPTPVPAQKLPVTSSNASESQASDLNYKGLSFSEIKGKIAEAKRQMAMRPLTIASVEPISLVTIIRVAFYDTNEHKIDSFVLTKDQFLSPGAGTMLMSEGGKQIITRTIRGNGVNTPVVVTDANGKPHLPLIVQYPRETRGVFTEMAYYVSTHPGIVTPEVVNAGRFYVSNTIDVAREQLKRKGYAIQPKVADIAEVLATLEHVDHLRFRTEYHPNIYNDIFTLYALNEGQTYRYSVSSAGAGGMVQMIPSTYRMVRSRFPNAALMPDFVEGMRNHVNASQAMLLYMQMTWNDLSASATVREAMATGIATQEQLMAAGYNSNPAKLARYISRGGENWTDLIPRETKIYLQIWDSLERHVTIKPRKQ